MADISAEYTLTTPAGTIIFNDGDLKDGTDKYWLSNITGLDGPGLRTPMDNAPLADGGLIHTFWKTARHIVFEGVLVHDSVGFPAVGDACITAQNEMEEALIIVLESILQDTGTLAWTPLGLSARSLTVKHDVTLNFTAQENYAIKTFTFGLVAGNPDW